MIYLTGDTHIPIDIGKLNKRKFPEQNNMTRKDYVIVLGDFGLLFRDSKDKTYKYYSKTLSKKNFTLLWLDGNHENFNWINSLPVTRWNGGKVHMISNNIIHLMRGQVFNIDNIKFFVCGGASSIDKAYRTENISWWPQEDISNQEIEEAYSNLDNNDWSFDYVLTHTCPSSIVEDMFKVKYLKDPTSEFLDDIYKNEKLKYKKWYFGHWHMDFTYNNFHTLYNNIVKLS